MSHLVRKPTMWFANRSDTNRAVQSQKMVRGWKFWIYKVEELYYPCRENKGTDQLRRYCEADLRLCFHLCRLLVFPCGGSYDIYTHGIRNTEIRNSVGTEQSRYRPRTGCRVKFLSVKHLTMVMLSTQYKHLQRLDLLDYILECCNSI